MVMEAIVISSIVFSLPMESGRLVFRINGTYSMLDYNLAGIRSHTVLEALFTLIAFNLVIVWFIVFESIVSMAKVLKSSVLLR